MLRPKQVLLKWIEYINAHKAVEIADLYHNDAVNLQLAIGVPLIGKEAIFHDFVSFFEHNPDTFTHVVNLFEDGEWAILEWSGGGTFYPDRKNGHGKKFSLSGCGFFQVIDGKIKLQRGYWDKASWESQVGMLSKA